MHITSCVYQYQHEYGHFLEIIQASPGKTLYVVSPPCSASLSQLYSTPFQLVPKSYSSCYCVLSIECICCDLVVWKNWSGAPDIWHFDILTCLKTFCKSIHRIFLIIVGRWRLRIRLATKWHWVGFSFLKLLFTARQPVPLLRNHKSSKTPPRSDWLAAAETSSAVTWKSNWLEPPLGIAFLIQSIGARPSNKAKLKKNF